MILVEGQTEEKFIKELLAPYFENKSIYIVPIIVSTSRRKSGSKYKGETAPSKRILKIYPKYQKVTDGIIISKKIVIEKMRQKCHHFNDWIIFMENIL